MEALPLLEISGLAKYANIYCGVKRRHARDCHPGHAVDIEPVSRRFLQNLGIFQIASGDFQPAVALKTRICSSETIVEFKKRRIGGLLRRNSLSL
jgi:hypothetical protein